MAGMGNPGLAVRTAAPASPFPSLISSSNTWADRVAGVGFRADLHPTVSRDAVGFQGGINLSGLMAIGALVLLVFALDRYVLDVPGVGGK